MVETTGDSTEVQLNGSSSPGGGKRICRENCDEGEIVVFVANLCWRLLHTYTEQQRRLYAF